MNERARGGLGPQAPGEETLLNALSAAGVAVSERLTDRLAMAHDASHYLLTPLAVATPRTAEEVASVMAAGARSGVPITFRSGGTSLSGQGGSAGLLVDTRRNFRSIEVLDDGARVRVGPGATVRAVNARLARFRAKLGPDPASEVACTIGGVVANNSSGMACGVEANSYRTLDSAVLVLPGGTVVDTRIADADERLRRAEPAIHAGLLRLRDRVRGDDSSVATLRRLHSLKNTMGYGLNSFLDFDAPADILEHLVVGSEGTLAFVAEATFRTVPIRPATATGLLIFPTLAAAADALPALVAAGFATIELMDATSLRVAQRDPGAPDALRRLDVGEQAALLVEFQEATEAELARRIEASAGPLAALELVEPAALTSDRAVAAQLWHIRKGLYTTVAGSRPSGTSALLEDVAVPVERLGAVCEGLIALFDVHGYRDSVIFGHAKDGNIHFMLNERFDDLASLRRYRAFTEDMVRLILTNGGTLKAEHGTGRIMAPFVRRQYGDELFEVMRAVKALIDPGQVLNPGVLLSDDPDAYVRELKTSPSVEEEVDRCVECGYCEPACPSRDLTLTPRQRIVLRRERARAEAAGDDALVRELDADYRHDGVETCAVDGMCQTACPVRINTGDLVRRLRAEGAGRVEQAAWRTAGRHWDAASRVIGGVLTVAAAVPAVLPETGTTVARALLGADRVPRYSAGLPHGGARRPVVTHEAARAVYFASCMNTMFGPEGESGVGDSFLSLCRRAGVSLRTPEDLPDLCCGTPWKSKGMSAGYAEMVSRVAASLRRSTEDGLLPVVCDASSCTEGLEVLLAAAQQEHIRVIDAVAFVAEHVLPVLPPTHKLASLVLHPTCSSTQLDINDALTRIADAVADIVTVPDDWGCCAFAGDRGMLHPELTATATGPEAAELAGATASAYASLNRTCELGMTRATGRPYRHILQLLDEAVAPDRP
ncbi:MAG TPA: FAD-binding and (Fe-S)-binding domain-containing protein [Gryllotalpicola sp.]